MVQIQGFFPYFISLFPGLGHLYMQRPVKALGYGIPFWTAVLMFFVILFDSPDFDPLLLLFAGGVILWSICFIDMILTIRKLKAYHAQAFINPAQQTYTTTGYGRDPFAPEAAYSSNQAAQQPPFMKGPSYQHLSPASPPVYDPERSKVLLLSFIPGLAHFHLGLMKRGLSIMVLFFGIPIFIFFVVGMTGGDSFLAFLLALPVILFYGMYDALNLLKRKQANLELIDCSFFDDFYHNRSNQKNRTVATLLSIFPGAGHLYIGMQIRGIQLMIGFLLSLYMLDVLRLSFFLFLIPVFWFFSFFDALQGISRLEHGEVKDIPIVSGLQNYHRWIGVGMLLLGLYVVFDRISPLLYEKVFGNTNYYYLIRDYFNISVVSLILIISGFVLLFRKKKN